MAHQRYRKLCAAICSQLVVEDRRKVLVYFKVERSFYLSQNVEEDTKFIDKLEMNNFISETNVSALAKCFKDMEMNALSNLMEEYQANISEEGDSLDQHEDGEEVAPCTLESCHHIEGNRELLCVTCSALTCFKCAFYEHQDHHVLTGDQMDEEIKKCENSLKDEMETAEIRIKFYEEGANFFSKSDIYAKIYLGIEVFADNFRKAVEAQRTNSLLAMKRMTKVSQETMQNVNMELQRMTDFCSNIRKDLDSSADSNKVRHLQKLNHTKSEVSKHISTVEDMQDSLRDTNTTVSLRSSSISANFMDLSFGSVAGAVRVNVDQVILVHDQRNNDTPSIRMCCVSCANTSFIFWNNSIELVEAEQVNFRRSKLTVCGRLFITPKNVWVLIGCGSKIFLGEIKEPKDRCYFISSSSFDVEIPDGSWVTGISTIPATNLDYGILVADKLSKTIRRFDRTFKLVEKITCNGICEKVTGYFENNLTIAYSEDSEVKVIKADSPNEVVQAIKAPRDDPDFCPTEMFYDGSFFSIMWFCRKQKMDANRKYKVIAYRSNGEFINVSCEGTCESQTKAVGITHVVNEGLLAFSDGKIICYTTVNI